CPTATLRDIVPVDPHIPLVLVPSPRHCLPRSEYRGPELRDAINAACRGTGGTGADPRARTGRLPKPGRLSSPKPCTLRAKGGFSRRSRLPDSAPFAAVAARDAGAPA